MVTVVAVDVVVVVDVTTVVADKPSKTPKRTDVDGPDWLTGKNDCCTDMKCCR